MRRWQRRINVSKKAKPLDNIEIMTIIVRGASKLASQRQKSISRDKRGAGINPKSKPK